MKYVLLLLIPLLSGCLPLAITGGVVLGLEGAAAITTIVKNGVSVDGQPKQPAAIDAWSYYWWCQQVGADCPPLSRS